MNRYLIQETTDGSCPAGCWAEFGALTWEDACACQTGVAANQWGYTDQAFVDLHLGHRVCRVQQFDDRARRWSQRWYSTRVSGL
jgi:hypothetical protein